MITTKYKPYPWLETYWRGSIDEPRSMADTIQIDAPRTTLLAAHYEAR